MPKKSLVAENIHPTLLGLKTECPKCWTESEITEDNCFTGKYTADEQLAHLEQRKLRLKTEVERIYTSIHRNTKAVNIGFTAERLFPALPVFRFNHGDCRSTGGDPLDYTIFEGLSQDGIVNHIYFVDVKTGGAILKPRQIEIKNTVTDKNIKFRTY